MFTESVGKSEYRNTDRPLEPLQRLDRAGRVIYIGTFSKTLALGTRPRYILVQPPSQGLTVVVLTQRAANDTGMPSVCEEVLVATERRS